MICSYKLFEPSDFLCDHDYQEYETKECLAMHHQYRCLQIRFETYCPNRF